LLALRRYVDYKPGHCVSPTVVSDRPGAEALPFVGRGVEKILSAAACVFRDRKWMIIRIDLMIAVCIERGESSESSCGSVVLRHHISKLGDCVAVIVILSDR
jgi:hypothetical protein